MRKLSIVWASLAAFAFATPAIANEAPLVDKQDWAWIGLFGQYDRAQLKRGFQVYHDVCSNCHSLHQVAYRNLSYLGFSEDEIKALAAEKSVTAGPNDQGDMFQRPATAADRFVPPFPNEQAARVANNGALPPDLSLMTKARKDGPDYLYALMTGFADPPADVQIADGMFYNKAFPGHQIAMPPQIDDNLVSYADGTAATKSQIAKDVVAFLNWAAEPELDARHRLGLKVIAFLVVLTALFVALKRKIWSDLH